ncbi:MAG: class I SAM-dependent methyltransferase [Kofleriaceae bacterium]|nr:class I SAM-dependent methyltransferase [Kofleriaceae bacterium]
MAKSQRFLEVNRASWNRIAGSTKGRTALPNYGPLCPGEEELGLLGDVSGKRIVELGCGDGKSLAYLHAHGSEELYGLDLAEEQVAGARAVADELGYPAKLFCSPMEEDPGLPHDYFDIALSLYALGWSVDLDASLARITSYLKPGGILVYSWEHPVYSCLKSRDKELYLARSYSTVGPVESLSWNGDPIVMHARKISTFINATIGAGLVLDEVIEGDMRPKSEGSDYPRRWYSRDRATLMPTTLIVKAHKPVKATPKL